MKQITSLSSNWIKKKKKSKRVKQFKELKEKDTKKSTISITRRSGLKHWLFPSSYVVSPSPHACKNTRSSWAFIPKCPATPAVHSDVLPCLGNPSAVCITQVDRAHKMFLCCVILIMSVSRLFLKMAPSFFSVWQRRPRLHWRGCSIIKVSLT